MEALLRKNALCTWLVLAPIVSTLPTFFKETIEEPDLVVWEDEINEWNETMTFEPYEINTARLTIKSTITSTIEYWGQTTDCKGCALLKQATIESEGNYTSLANTWYSTQLQIRDSDSAELCNSGEVLVKERGEYWLIVYPHQDGGNVSIACDLVLYNHPPNIYLPLLWMFLILLGLAIIWIILKCLWRHGVCDRCQPSKESHDLEPVSLSQLKLELGESETEVDSIGNGHPVIKLPLKPAEEPRKRLRSLDTFRGLSLMVMIFVNYAGTSSYYFFSHVTWDGLYVADLVFPWFIWIMGTSMIFSLRGMWKRETATKLILWKICKRSFWLFAIGIFLGSGYGVEWETFRIPGVLQRFSVTYFVVAITHFAFGNRSLHENSKWWSPIRDVAAFIPEWIVMLGLTALHLALTFAFAEPGCPKGYLGPGGLHAGGSTYNCSGGAAGYIDRQFFGDDHIYRWNSIKTVYQALQNHDPEGILGSLTSVLMCFLGLQAGKIITAYTTTRGRLIRFLIWAIITGGVGVLLSKASLGEEGWIPINKNLWSVSFVLVLSGMAFILLAALYLVIDVWAIWSGAPLFYPGMNSIVIYACHSIFASYLPVYWVMPDATLHWQTLLMVSWGTGVWIVVAYIMYRKKVFIAL